MKTPTLRPAKVDPDRLVLIPPAEEPNNRLLIILSAMALVAATALGGGIVYAWQQGVVHDRDQAVHDAQVEAAQARHDADGAFATIASLQSQITSLQSDLERQRAQGDIQQGQISDAQARAERSQATVAELKDQLQAVTGPPVSNGKHIAYLLAAGTEQSPPMIVIDLGRWYTGDRARAAATTDGALGAGQHLFHGRYLRNTDHDWRILEVATGALFTIRHYNGATVPTNVSFTTLAPILNGSGSQRIAHNPFWVQVEHHHLVVSGHEQRYRAP